jgi:hypothetical protein
LWAGIIALFAIAMSVHLHGLYGRLHWPGTDPDKTYGEIINILHIDSMVVAAFALGLSIICLLKGNRILCTISLVLSFGALMISMILC